MTKKPPYQGQLLPRLETTAELVTITLFRSVSLEGQDDIRRFAQAVWRQEHPLKQSNVVRFPLKIRKAV
jgi:hypothetical protein